MKIKDKDGTTFYSNDVEGDIVFANDRSQTFYNLEEVFELKKGFVIVALNEGGKK